MAPDGQSEPSLSQKHLGWSGLELFGWGPWPLLQPCLECLGKTRLWNMHQSRLLKVANGKKLNSNCLSTKRNVGAHETKSSVAHLLRLGLDLGAHLGHLDSLHLPSQFFFSLHLLCRAVCFMGVSQQLRIYSVLAFPYREKVSASFSQQFQVWPKFACPGPHVHSSLKQSLRPGEVVFSLARAGSQASL